MKLSKIKCNPRNLNSVKTLLSFTSVIVKNVWLHLKTANQFNQRNLLGVYLEYERNICSTSPLQMKSFYYSLHLHRKKLFLLFLFKLRPMPTLTKSIRYSFYFKKQPSFKLLVARTFFKRKSYFVFNSCF